MQWMSQRLKDRARRIRHENAVEDVSIVLERLPPEEVGAVLSEVCTRYQGR